MDPKNEGNELDGQDEKETSADNNNSPVTDAPEVEAEVVEEEPTKSADSGDTPDPDVEEIVAEPISDTDTADEAAATETSTAAPAKKILTPGVVLFLVFAVATGIMFVIWRMQSPSTPPTASATRPSIASTITRDDTDDALENLGADVSDAAIDDEPVNAPDAATVVAEAEETDVAEEDEVLEAVDSVAAEDVASAEAVAEETAENVDEMALAATTSETTENATDAPTEASDEMVADETAAENSSTADDASTAEETTVAASDAATDDATTPAEDVAETDDTATPVEDAADLFAADPTGAQETNMADTGAEEVVEDETVAEETATAEIDAATTEASTDEAVTETAVASEDETARLAASIENDLDAFKDAIRVETTALNEALEEERRLSREQQAEIQSLREEFAETLQRRDAEAFAALSDLRARLDKLQSDDGAPAGRDVAASLALSSLQRTADQGAPFVQELDVLERLAPNSSAVSRLHRYSEDGAPTLTSLKSEFAPAAVRALAVAGRDHADGWAAQIGARLQSLVSVRPATPKSGETPRAIISRAEYALENDDVATAVTELAALTGGAHDAMSDWIEKAEARANVDAALDDLNLALLQKLQSR